MTAFDVNRNIIFVLSKACQEANAELKQELEDWNITPAQFYVLASLWENDGLFQVELAHKTKIDRSTICGIIDRLEKEGLLIRQHVSKDRRAHQIALTPRGKNLEMELCETVSRLRERLVARITSKGYLQLEELLIKLANID